MNWITMPGLSILVVPKLPLAGNYQGHSARYYMRVYTGHSR